MGSLAPSPRSRVASGWAVGREAGPFVRHGHPLADQRAQHGLVLGVARVQGAQVGGLPPPARRAGVVVDDRLHDSFVRAGLVGAAAQDVGEVAAGFGEQVAAGFGWRRVKAPRITYTTATTPKKPCADRVAHVPGFAGG